MSLRVIFFDAAGTLIHPAEPVGVTYSRIAGTHGIRAGGEELARSFRAAWKALPPPEYPPGVFSDDDDRSWWKWLVVETFRIALDRPLDLPVIDSLFDELYGHYSLHSAWCVYEEVPSVLEDLGRYHRLIVLSNFDRRLHDILSGHGLLRHFERVIISSEVGVSKPHPRIFETALAAAGCSAAECLHVGDDLRCDGAGAREAGMSFFHVQRPPGGGLDALAQKVRDAAHSGLRLAL